jgi:hypothetical protein
MHGCGTYVDLVGPVARDGRRVAGGAVRAAARLVGAAHGLRNRTAAPAVGDLAAEGRITVSFQKPMLLSRIFSFFREKNCQANILKY